ncbi:glycosyltransferase family 2 protein [Candidatus Babeliales bacterium]|nr:glycosyltransferase family 2 protein [Candidatus Babeliales bacterium]
MNNKKLSIVIPMFNEQGNIELLYNELLTIIKQLKYFKNFEIIAVNDGSQDSTLQILKKIAQKDSNFKVISFTRNFGHEQATYAGIHNTNGEAVILIDADRQDPPELILEFEKEFLNGYHIVYGQRSKRENESIFKKLTSKAFYPIFKFFTKIDLPQNVGDFCLMSRKAVDFFKRMPEKTLFIRGLVYWSGLPKKAILFIRKARYSGKSKYNYTKLTIFALENIISFSTTPIYAIIFLSILIIISCFIGVITALLMKIFGYVILIGWTSIIISILFLFAVTLFSLGMIGLYIGKIFQEIKNRPVFLIDEKINF